MDRDFHDEVQDILSCFGCYIVRVSAETPRSYHGANIPNNFSTSIELTCDSPNGFLTMLQYALAHKIDTEHRDALLKKYPAAREAYLHYKSIEMLCDDNRS